MPVTWNLRAAVPGRRSGHPSVNLGGMFGLLAARGHGFVPGHDRGVVVGLDGGQDQCVGIGG